jgi:hypothetical protein
MRANEEKVWGLAVAFGKRLDRLIMDAGRMNYAPLAFMLAMAREALMQHVAAQLKAKRRKRLVQSKNGRHVARSGKGKGTAPRRREADRLRLPTTPS